MNETESEARMPNRFNKDAVIVAQNATIPAVQLAAAIITANPERVTTTESALALFDEVRTHIFEGSMALAGVEDIEAFIDTVPSRAPSGRGGSGGGAPRNNGGGNQAPGDVAFNVGKHKGETIAQVHESDPEYLTWAVDKMRNDFMVTRIKSFLAEG